jgi:outer membrane protein TolC
MAWTKERHEAARRSARGLALMGNTDLAGALDHIEALRAIYEEATDVE